MLRRRVPTSIFAAALLVVVAAPAAASTPQLGWAGAFGGPNDDWSAAVAVDDAANVYTTGSFTFTADFDPGPAEYTLDADCCAIFVSKLDPSGGFLWAVGIGEQPDDQPLCLPAGTCLPFVTEGPNEGVCLRRGESGLCLPVADDFPYVESFDLAVDAAGNVYAVGVFQGTIDFDPGPGTYDLTGGGGLDVFVLKLDTAGDFVWARRWGGSGSDTAQHIAVDGAGSVHTAGSFSNVVDFDPGPSRFDLIALPPAADAFVSKLDAAGNLVWARTFAGPGYDVARGIDVDPAGNVLTAGYFELTADFDPDPVATSPLVAHGLLSGPALDVFVAKLDPAGNFVWARGLGGTGYDDAFDLAVDGPGNVHTIGIFCGEDADFDPGPGSAVLPSAGERCEVFLSKLDAGGGFVWARAIGGPEATLWPEGIAVGDEGDLHAAGHLDGTADFDPGPGSIELIGVADGFFARLDPSGDLGWAGLVGGSSFDRARGVAVDAVGGVYGTGNFAGTADLDPSAGTFNLTAPPNRYGHKTSDAFVLKLTSAA